MNRNRYFNPSSDNDTNFQFDQDGNFAPIVNPVSSPITAVQVGPTKKHRKKRNLPPSR
jgi:hypothetical protein